MTTATAVRQAVVTGLGVTSPNGFGIYEYWTATLRGREGVALAVTWWLLARKEKHNRSRGQPGARRRGR